jgi:NodT family efflux transporter outer membrane factor (OMF) lipoprotein
MVFCSTPRYASGVLKPPFRKKILCRWLVLIGLGVLSGCAIHRVDEEAQLLQVEIPDSFSEARSEDSLPNVWRQSWWATFEDIDLDGLIEAGLSGNFGLQQYMARIEQATAVARISTAELYPNLGYTAGYAAEWDGKTVAPSTGDRKDSTDLGVRLFWELDLWQRLSSLRRAEMLETEATIEDWLGARLLLSSAIAETYFNIKEQRRQLEVIREQIEINVRLLKLITLRFGQGQASIVDVLQQREQLEATQTRIPETESSIGQLEYTLALLLGLTSDAAEHITSTDLERPPELPAVGIPAHLITARPDLRSAQKRVLALDYDVGAAVADQFPSLVLGGSIDWRGDPNFGDEVYSVFAGLAGPLFNAGERRNEVFFRKARLEEALAGYSELYLAALLEVEGALLEERKNEESLVLVEKQLATAQRLLREAKNRFSQGLTDYLPVFTSLAIVQRLEREVVRARLDVLSSRVALHRALGGPMPNPDIPIYLSLTE